MFLEDILKVVKVAVKLRNRRKRWFGAPICRRKG